MTALIRLALKRPTAVTMFFLAVFIFGTIAAVLIPIDYLPAIPVPKLIVSASYPGLPPAKVRELLAIPLEESFSSINGITSITSVCRRGTAAIELTFSWGTDMTIAAVETREYIDSGYHRLPTEAEKPVVLPVTPGEPPVLTIAAVPADGDLITARRLCEREVTSRLQQIEGTGSVTVSGGLKEEIHITVDEQKAARMGLSAEYIARALRLANSTMPAGSIEVGDTEYMVITEAKFTDLEEIAGLRIPPPASRAAASGFGGGPASGLAVGTALDEFAEISFSPGKQQSLFLADGEEAVVLQVRRRGDASPVTLARKIREELARVSQSYRGRLSFTVMDNSAELITSSVRSLLFQTLFGISASFGVLYLFLKDIRTALVILVMIPASLLFTVIVLAAAGKSLNIMSLGGIALSTGMIVDNGIVALESMVRNADAERGAAEVSLSIFGSTLTTMIVFVPVVFIPGMIGSLYTDLALSVVFALTGSYLCSITLLPALFTALKIKDGPHPRRRTISRVYGVVLARFIRKPLLLLLAAGTAGVWGAVFISRTDAALFPEVHTGSLSITVRLPAGTPMKTIKRTGREMYRTLLERGLITGGFSLAGGEEDDPSFISSSESRRENLRMQVVLPDTGAEQTAGYHALITSLIKREESDVSVSGEDDPLTFLLGGAGRASGSGGPSKLSAETEILVTGNSPEEARRRARELAAEITGGDYLKEVSIAPEEDTPELTVLPREDLLLKTGIRREAVASAVRAALEGIVATTYEQAGEEVPLRVFSGTEPGRGTGAIRKLSLAAGKTSGSGEVENGPAAVSVGAAADIIEKDSPSRLLRVNRKDAVFLRLPPLSGLPAEAAAETDNGSLIEEQLPALIAVFSLALLLMYLALGAQFESFLTPLILFISLPLSITGIFAGLCVSGNAFTISSSMGVLVLMGIAINNAIILFETYRKEQARGRTALSAVFRGSLARVRPILMTAITTAAALLPIAVDPYNRSNQSGMAAAVIGGLLFSTLLTLLILPPAYLAFQSRKRRVR